MRFFIRIKSVVNMLKYYKLYILSLIFSYIHIEVNAQRNLKFREDPYNFQYGFSMKVAIEFGYKSPDPIPVFKLTFNTGVASDFISSWLYPSFNIEVQLYNGGFGSKSEKQDDASRLDLDIIAALTATSGIDNHLINRANNSLQKRDIPLYYFSDFVYPALQNPYDNSFSVGTNIIFTPLNKDKQDQRVGFINAHFGHLQISYFNDGGAVIGDSYLGDRKDRYYTGGAVISYHDKPNTSFNLLELSYKKFTGYTKNAFELSNNLFLNFMNYHSPEQKMYNKSVWSINIGNVRKGWAVKLSSYNKIRWDMQHYIHSRLFNTYHMVPYNPFWTISGSYYNSYINLGVK